MSNHSRAAMVNFLVEWTRLWGLHNQQTAIKTAAENEINQINFQINDCRAAFRVLGHDSNDAASWERVQTEYGNDWRIAWEQFNSLAVPPQVPQITTESPAAASRESRIISQVPVGDDMPKVSDIILEQLKIAGDKGSKAATIRDYIFNTYSRSLHEKTIGMSLFRLSKKGLVRRIKQTWFFVPPEADAKNPGASTPGQLEFLD